MKKLIGFAFVLAVAACGGAASSPAMDNTMYKAPPATLFSTAKDVMNSEHYKVVKDDGAAHIETEAIWYAPSGSIDTSTGENISRLQEDSINIAYNIDVQTTGDSSKVVLTPVIHRKHGLSSLPETMDPSDPALPGWVGGRTAKLQEKLHDALGKVGGAAAPAAGDQPPASTVSPLPGNPPAPISQPEAPTAPAHP
ncbi:MAG TPA: hypothetical protein VGC41_01270 [Kofleriaceae bacterium]